MIPGANRKLKRGRWISWPDIVAVVAAGAIHLGLMILQDSLPEVALELCLLALLVAVWKRGWISPNIPLAHASGIISLLMQPAMGWWPFVWFVLIPMFAIARGAPNRLSALFYGTYAGALCIISVFPWIVTASISFLELHPVVAIISFIPVSIYIGLQFGLFVWLTRLLSDFLSLNMALIGMVVYPLCEYWMPALFPYQISICYAWNPIFAQLADLIGMTGLTVSIAAINASFFAAWDGFRAGRRRAAITALIIGLLFIVAQFGYGMFSLYRYAPDGSEDSVEIAMIQPVAPLKITRKDVELKRETARSIVALSEQAIDEKAQPPDLLVWPEGAAPFAYLTPAYNPEYLAALKPYFERHDVPLLVQDIEFARNAEGNGPIRYYNHASLIGGDGSYLSGYRKIKRLPFAEYLPAPKALGFLRGILPEIRSVLAGDSFEPLPLPGGPGAAVICYELTDPRLVRQFVNNGATYIVNLTNDLWYGVEQQPYQHLAFAVFRAIENRRPVARCTNSGISAFVDARGVITEKTELMEKTWLRGKVYPRFDRTIYSYIGDILPRWILPPVFLAMVFRALANYRKSKSHGRDPRILRGKAGK